MRSQTWKESYTMQSEKIDRLDRIAVTSDVLACPVCQEALTSLAQTYLCPRGHAFDLARQGYLNLLLAQQKKSREPGDSKEMIASRMYFLDQGYYRPLSEQVNQTALACLSEHEHLTLLDAGCGEGYYLTRLREAFTAARQSELRYVGVDISRAAIQRAAQRSKAITWLVASVVALPLRESSCTLLLSIFAPSNFAEFARVLAPCGELILVTPGPTHLYELRELLYTDIVEHTQEDLLARASPAFETIRTERVVFDLQLDTAADIMSLYRMTPFFWKSSPPAHTRIEQLTALKTHADIYVRTLQKRHHASSPPQADIQAQHA